MAALSYDESPNVMIVGVGLMGQYLANHVGAWLGAAKLVLVDGADVINVAGKKVNPVEVEAHLLSHGKVREAVVFGRSSALRNQEVVACVVATGTVDEAELLAYCRARLSGWQAPKRIFLLDALPANERGKVSRRELARRFVD